MQDWQNERTTVHDDALTAKTGPNEGHFLRRAAIKARNDQADGKQGNEADADQK
ncbi:hypothetical protein QW131_04045 [Roseibium salinum]|nr:hypothetical protein [Roseibium salinum]